MAGVSCWNNSNYTGTGVGYTTNTPGMSAQVNSISSCIINPWTSVNFWTGSSYRAYFKTYNNASVYPLNIPYLGTEYYDNNTSKSLNDSINSVQISAIQQPACVDAMNAYLDRNPDVKAARIDPWQHYVNSGQYEGRYWGDNTCDGSANRCTPGKNAYLINYPDVAAAGMDAWSHYVSYGRSEGRAWTTITCDGSAAPYTDPNNCPRKTYENQQASIKAFANVSSVFSANLNTMFVTYTVPAALAAYGIAINLNSTVGGYGGVPHGSGYNNPDITPITNFGVTNTVNYKFTSLASIPYTLDFWVTFDNQASWTFIKQILVAMPKPSDFALALSKTTDTSVTVSYAVPAIVPADSVALLVDGARNTVLSGGNSATTIIKNLTPNANHTITIQDVL
jgi:hypothetical protein